MYSAVKDQLASELDEIRAAGLYKAERVIATPQQANDIVQADLAGPMPRRLVRLGSSLLPCLLSALPTCATHCRRCW